jgi:Holliday junction DNA helicase RuvA
MIASLSGTIRLKNPTRVILETAGIGFDLTIPLSTSRVLAEPGAPATLSVQSVFTREGMLLFGFATADEKDIFIRLTDIKGIGPRAALNLLSRFTPAEITVILTEARIETLKTVPGIGPKRAETILGRTRTAAPAHTPTEPGLEPALAALTSLGLTRSEALRRLEAIPERASLTLNDLLMRTLRCDE